MTDQIDYTSPLAALAPGSKHAGFTVTDVQPLPELTGCAYLMRHDASGARALWLATADNNKSFSIAFKTPPADDTGVFHILEHSVLCGSDRYPVKEPFVNLLKTSMQTFLNAMTFPDKTMYPVASTNTADLENLMGVYLDAVLHPAIYARPRIFEQEGWHLEVEKDDAGEKSLVYNGVVFNEMKGALSDPDDVLFQQLSRSLFPDTAYRFESGGNPRAIPQLTYENFLDNHARHYNLANSYTILYGAVDIDRELALIDQHFQAAAQRTDAASNALALQAPVAAARRTVEMATAPNNSTVGVSYVIGTAAERTRVLAADVLLDALCGSNEAPLKRRILDADLADDFQAMLLDGMLQPQVMFQLKGLREGAGEKFRPVLEAACAELVEDGIPADKLRASLAQAEFNLRENDWGGYPDGVALSMQAMSGWLYDDGAALDYLRYEDALASLKEGLANGMFEQLLSELVCNSAHSAEVEIVPVEGGDAAEEAAELAALRAKMSDADLDRIEAEVAALRAEQEAPDSPEALATLPQLTLADVDDPAPEPAAATVDAPLPCVAHELPTHGIDYVYHYFDLRRLAFEDLPYVGVLCDLLGKLDTAAHNASDLDTLIEENLGGLSFFTETYGHDSDPAFASPKLVVAASALGEKVGALASIPSEVWGTTRFDDLERVRAILTQKRIGLEQHFTGAGHSSAMGRLSTFFSSAALVGGQMNGVDYYLFLRDLLERWDDLAGELPARLAGLAARIFTSDEVLVSFVGSAAERDAFWQAGGTLGLEPAGPAAAAEADPAAHQLVVPALRVRNEAFVIPSNVSFVATGTAPTDADPAIRAGLDTPEGCAAMGVWQVATRPLSYDYLWNEVRVKGGAYGVGFRRTSNGARFFWSYRDPSIDGTLERYAAATEWLRDWQPTDDELCGYVVSTIAAHDAPVKPRQLARRQDMEAFSGYAADRRDRIRAGELACTVDQLRELAGTLAAEAPRAICVFGPREAIEASSVEFESVTELS